MLIVGIIIGAIILYAVLSRSGNAEDEAEAMWADMQREKADAEAWERITK